MLKNKKLSIIKIYLAIWRYNCVISLNKLIRLFTLVLKIWYNIVNNHNFYTVLYISNENISKRGDFVKKLIKY
jgi:hypothetical protein